MKNKNYFYCSTYTKTKNVSIIIELVGILNISNNNKHVPQSKTFALYEKGLQVQPTTQNFFSCNIKKRHVIQNSSRSKGALAGHRILTKIESSLQENFSTKK